MVYYMMKLIFLLLTTLTFAANEPVYIKGQAETTALKLRDLQAPNEQITKLGTENFLVETGNQNLLENPSFEHPTVGFGWTDASTNTKSAETSVVIHGKKSLKIVLSANDVNLTQTSTLYASQFGGTTQGVASIRIKTDVLVKICTVEAGVTSPTNCLNSSLDNQWHVYKIPFVLGATSNGINIFVDSGTGTVYLDDAFVGAMEVTAVTDASRIAGEAVFPPTSSCLWSRSSPTIGAFTSTSACPGPTIVKQHVGSWQTTDTNLPQITVNSLPAGVYKATFFVPTYSGITSQNAIAINDGTTTCAAVNVNSTTSSGQGVVSCTFEYSTTANRTFSLYGSSTTSTINIENNTSGDATRGVKFQLEYYTSFSSYSSLNADTDWVDMGVIAVSSTGGTPTKGTTTIDKVLMKRTGVNAEIIYKYQQTAGAAGSGEVLYSLPAGLQFDTSVITPYSGAFSTALEAAGQNALIGYGHATTTLTTNRGIVSLFAYDATRFRAIITAGFSSWQVQNATYFAFSSAIAFNFRINVPISTWNNSNIIIGQFNGLESCESTLECTDTFSAKISSAGVVSGENVDWLNGNCSVTSVSTITCPFNTGIFTVEPNCTILTDSSTNGNVDKQATSSSTNLVYKTYAAAGGSPTAYATEVICQKQGVDYIGKTAKAVASDQNLRTSGITKGVVYSVAVSSTGSIISEIGDIVNGSCTVSSGSFDCPINNVFKDDSYVCSCTMTHNSSAVPTSGDRGCQFRKGTTTNIYYSTFSDITLQSYGVNLVCHGVSP
jgi:hypothetical protein